MTPHTFPPDPVPVYQWRQAKLRALRADPALLASAKAYYRTHPVDFIEHWMNTYDPRLAGSDHPATMPFLLFARQKQMVQFLLACLRAKENGLIEKSRDMGASWLACAFSVWLFLFWDGASIGWGSRKEQLVDRAGDPDSLFEKMRMLLADIPREFLPTGFTPRLHCARMKILNPENGASITGEAGHNIGRGGRKLIYFKDESAHYEQAESIEAALADTTNVQIDMSSVNGIGNVFHRRREAGREWQSGEAYTGVTNVFVLDWRDHPGKTNAWYKARKRKATADGLAHIFAQEVERNYAASVEGVIIPPDWVRAAVDAHKLLGFAEGGAWVGALDVADSFAFGGMDKNAFAARQGPVLRALDCWAARDTGETTRRS
ncbi:MAG: TerL protein, partial [Acidimicrobiales bacterium]